MTSGWLLKLIWGFAITDGCVGPVCRLQQSLGGICPRCVKCFRSFLFEVGIHLSVLRSLGHLVPMDSRGDILPIREHGQDDLGLQIKSALFFLITSRRKEGKL